MTTGTTVSGGGELVSGVANGTVLVSGSNEYIEAGLASGTVISADSTEVVFAGGAEADAHVLSGGTLTFAGGALQLGQGQSLSGFDLGNAARISSLVSSMVMVDSGGVLQITSTPELAVGDGATAINTRVTGNELIVNSGGVTTASLVAGGTSDSPLFQGVELVQSGGVAIGTIVNSGGEQRVESGGTAVGTIINAGGAVDMEGGTLTGTIISSSGDEVISGGVAYDTIVSGGGIQGVLLGGTTVGTVISSGGVEDIGDPNFPSPDSIASGSIVESGGRLIVDRYAAATDTVLHVGGAIEVVYFAYASGATATLDATTDVLTIAEGGETHTLQLSGNYTNEFFHLTENDSPDSPMPLAPDTVITVDSVPCYCCGTRVLTDRGERVVEDLHVGDRLMTLSGTARRIRWIGRRSYGRQFVKNNRKILPVQFRPGSLADGVPRRDLFVSPEHAMFIDGALVPAIALVNGLSIVRVESAEQVEYVHLELETHDVILAEGAPSETFVDDGGRAMFHNAAEYAALYPDAAPQPARYCAPRLEDGPALEALRRRLAARHTVPARASGPLQGFVDSVDRSEIRGWALDGDGPVLLQVTDNGAVLGQAKANVYRADLAQAQIGDGWHGFEFTIPGGLSPLERHVIEVRRAPDGQALQHSPWLLEIARRAG